MSRSSGGKRKAVRSKDRDEKLSVRLVELIEPFEPACENLKAFERLVALGSAAWNLTVFPPEVRGEQLLRILELIPLEDRAYAETFILRLVAEKEKRFPADKRLISSAQVFDEGDEYRVSVASIRTDRAASFT